MTAAPVTGAEFPGGRVIALLVNHRCEATEVAAWGYPPPLQGLAIGGDSQGRGAGAKYRSTGVSPSEVTGTQPSRPWKGDGAGAYSEDTCLNTSYAQASNKVRGVPEASLIHQHQVPQRRVPGTSNIGDTLRRTSTEPHSSDIGRVSKYSQQVIG
eukprot:GHVN01081589.1.p2 GENE.GHVN01081589.1~~GHVN01081589.1.p2  ORF type:complete len:155 (-),score=8.53 GHVN01081589.1:86-550(-)